MNSDSRRWHRPRHYSVVAATVILLTLTSCSERESPEELVSPSKDVSMEVDRTRLESGDRFHVTYKARTSDSITLSPHLVLQGEGKDLYLLFLRGENESGPAYGPLGSDVNDMGVTVDGRYEYEVPPLDRGTYSVCNRFSVVETTRRSEEVCAHITVEG